MIYYQRGVFYNLDERDQDMIAIADNFYGCEINVIERISDTPSTNHTTSLFRGSCNLAYRLNAQRLFDYCNLMNWLPPLRDYAYNRHMYFQDMAQIGAEMIASDKPMFIKPCSPFKTFAGQVYTPDNFLTECSYLEQTNGDRFQMCGLTDQVEVPEIEWRCIFVDGKYVSGSQYMKDGELLVNAIVPHNVIEFAEDIAKHPYFLNRFEFVIDICTLKEKLYLLEVNGFQTSSFYASDHNAIYKAWRKSVYSL